MRRVYTGHIRLKSGEEVTFEAEAIQRLENGETWIRGAYFERDGELIGPFSINAVTGETDESDIHTLEETANET